MRYSALQTALTVALALCVCSCSTTRKATSSSEELRSTELRSTESRDSVTIELRDTLREVTTITIDRNDAGDTLRVTQITDRTRASTRDRVKDVEVKIVEKTDTVYIERKDSAEVTNTNLSNPTKQKSNLVAALKWIFWIVCAIIVLIIVIKLGLRRSLF